MKTAKEKASLLVSDFVEMMPCGIDKIGYPYRTQYEVAKHQAEYAAHVAKWSQKKDSKNWNYWQDVQNEIKKL